MNARVVSKPISVIVTEVINMNDIKVFEHEKFGKVRMVLIDGEPWFVGIDVAKVLGYRNISRDVKRHVDSEDYRNYRNGSSEFNNRGVTVVNESGLYSLILGSAKKEVKEFKHWITSNVLPSIRKYGMYATEETI